MKEPCNMPTCTSKSGTMKEPCNMPHVQGIQSQFSLTYHMYK